MEKHGIAFWIVVPFTCHNFNVHVCHYGKLFAILASLWRLSGAVSFSAPCLRSTRFWFLPLFDSAHFTKYTKTLTLNWPTTWLLTNAIISTSCILHFLSSKKHKSQQLRQSWGFLLSRQWYALINGIPCLYTRCHMAYKYTTLAMPILTWCYMFAWSGRDEITLLADCLFAAKGICFLLSNFES